MLQAVRDQMEQMQDKDRHMVTESSNRKALLREVESLVVSEKNVIKWMCWEKDGTLWFHTTFLFCLLSPKLVNPNF